MSNPSRIQSIQTTYGPQISRRASDFGDHEGMGTPKITRWIAQFDNGDLPLAVKILQEIKYYSTENIRSMVRVLVSLSCHHFGAIDQNRIIFVPIGASYEGSSVIARALRDELRDQRRIKSMADLENLDPSTFDALVFLDDFSGTGNQLSEWWQNVESIVRPRNVPFAVALLVLNCSARNRIEKFTEVVCVDELNEGHNVLSLNSQTFTQQEKNRIIEYCRRTGCAHKLLFGFGKCGLLVAFKHQCPNNSLPILWYESGASTWESLFKRSGL